MPQEVVMVDELTAMTPLRVILDNGTFVLRVESRELRRSRIAEPVKGREPTFIPFDRSVPVREDRCSPIGAILRAGDSITADFADHCGFEFAAVARPNRRYIR